MTGSVPLVLGRVSIEEIRAMPDCRSWCSNSYPLREARRTLHSALFAQPVIQPVIAYRAPFLKNLAALQCAYLFL